ncbi:hypothetical protein Tco_0681648 [Tanacetum coccineum]|uniref:Uncharacterized protein n=1 Tax=Tanacetum coccineum TaxID=301880 RepID=A0ABQ4XNW8_9ASTR
MYVCFNCPVGVVLLVKDCRMINLIMKYLVKLSKRRAFWSLNEDILKIMNFDYQYAVSMNEDTAYPCLHSPKTTKEIRSIRRIQRRSIRHIKDIVCEDSGRYQAWSLLQETTIHRIQPIGYAPEWSRFVTAAKQEKNLHEVRFPDPLALIANTYNPPPSYSSQQSQYNQQPSKLHQHQPFTPPLQQHNYEPPIVQQQSPLPLTQLDSGLVVPSFLPTDDQIASLNKAMITQATIQDGKVTVQNVHGRQSQVYGVNTGKGKAIGT